MKLNAHHGKWKKTNLVFIDEQQEKQNKQKVVMKWTAFLLNLK